MTKQELQVAQVIFETIRLEENYPIKSCNDLWVQVDEVKISPEELHRIALEGRHTPILVEVEARTVLVEIDQSTHPISQTVTESNSRYSIALHRNPCGPGFCAHSTIEEALNCEFASLNTMETKKTMLEVENPQERAACPWCGGSGISDIPF